MHNPLPRLLILLCVCFALISPVSAQTADGPIYIVQPGDSLYSIAARFNISIDALMAANNLTDPDLLAAGQRLIIPGLEGVTGILNSEIINFGDSFRSLVRRTGVPVDLLRRLNHLVSPTEFYVGASMIIPQDAEAPPMAGIVPTAGESLFELAIRQGSDAWTLKELNDLGGTWDGLPGDVLYTPGDESSQPATGLPPAFISAEIKGLPLKQGGTGVIFVKTAPDVNLSGALIDIPLHFFNLEDGTNVALQGVHALLQPGAYPLRLDAALPDGSSQSYEQMMLVVSGNYRSEVIPLNDPATIDPAVTEPELQLIQSLISQSPSDRYWSTIFAAPAAYPDCYTSRFGTRRTYKVTNTQIQIPGFHTGLDFCGGEGLAITAPAPGRVIFAQPLTVRGNATIIDHGWGVYSGFWHQSEFRVQVGDIVEQGQLIGLVGGTGRVTGAHLHWEIWVNGVQVDPLDWLAAAYP
ncbi:MAG TPA: LysM peptidoglycan-binding domain-containing protein [Anaerolineales bacterium]|jgi:murein DD-endopeptidase MepM/ murein hydrolase activator NlpD